MHTVEEDNPLINIIVYYSLYHRVGMAMVHDDKYHRTQEGHFIMWMDIAAAGKLQYKEGNTKYQ